MPRARPSPSRAVGDVAELPGSLHFWYQPREYGSCPPSSRPNAYEPGFDLEDSARGSYGGGCTWNLTTRELERRRLGDAGSSASCGLRHDPDAAEGFAGATLSRVVWRSTARTAPGPPPRSRDEAVEATVGRSRSELGPTWSLDGATGSSTCHLVPRQPQRTRLRSRAHPRLRRSLSRAARPRERRLRDLAAAADAPALTRRRRLYVRLALLAWDNSSIPAALRAAEVRGDPAGGMTVDPASSLTATTVPEARRAPTRCSCGRRLHVRGVS